MIEKLKKNGWVVVFLILGLVHLIYLDRFPVGISHDEIEYLLSAKTYFLTGADLSGSYFPVSIFQTKTEGIISFLPALILAPYLGLIQISQFWVRLPYVLINLSTAVVLFFLVKKLFKNKTLGLITAGVFLINPWSFYLSRMATDTSLALVFYLLTILILVDDSKKKMGWSFLFLVLGFFSYHGAKVIFIPLILVLLGYRIWGLGTRVKNCWWILLAGLGLITLYFGIGGKFFNQSATQTRGGDIWLLDKEKISQTVDTYRKTTLDGRLTKLFINKATVMAEIFFQKYLTAFSPEVLFVSGDTRGTYRFGSYGLFYVTDVIFIIIGLIVLWKKYPKKAFFLVGLMLISPLATAVSGVETSVINRSFLLLPILVIFLAFGILTGYEVMSKKLGKVISLIFLVTLELGLFLSFGHFYFFRWPITGQENYFFSQKIVAEYINRIDEKKVVVVDKEPREIFLETVFFDKNNNRQVLKDFVKNQSFKFKNVSFVPDCPQKLEADVIYIINRSFDKCVPKDKWTSINEEQFGGPLYYIVNDGLCSNYELQPWLRFRFASNYVVEKLDNKDFCQIWIKRK